MLLKTGASLDGLSPILRLEIPVIDVVSKIVIHRQVEITSGTDPAPGRLPNSLHPKGLALDLSTHDLSDAEAEQYRKALSVALGPGFQVIYEKGGTAPHIHLELDPKALAAYVAAGAAMLALGHLGMVPVLLSLYAVHGAAEWGKGASYEVASSD